MNRGTCSDEDSITITALASSQVNLGRDTSACLGQTIVLDAGSSGNWNTGDIGQTISTDTSGLYIVTVGSGICQDLDSVLVTIASSLTVDLGTISAICDGDSVQLDAGFAGQTHLWSSGESTQMVWASAAGEYKVTVTDAQGCSGADSVLLSIESLPTVSLGNDVSVCSGDSMLIGGTLGSGSYIWSTGALNQTVYVSTAGEYIVELTDANNCSNTDTINLGVDPLPTPSITMALNACAGDAVVSPVLSPLGGSVTGTGVSSGSFDPTSSTITLGQATWVYYTYTDANSCAGDDSTSITVHSLPVASVNTLSSSLCAGGSATLGISGTGNTSYDWYQVGNATSLGNTDFLVTNDGDYYATISDGNCSSYTDTLNVSLSSPSLSVLVSPSAIITEGGSVTLSVENPNGAFTYDWVNQTTGEVFSGSSWNTAPNESSQYVLTASFDTCSLTEQLMVTVIPLPAVDDVLFPDAFTPNRDGVNDEFTILNIEDYPNAEVIIFNRWEFLIYMSEGGASYQANPWDGTYEMKQVPAGVYYYSVYLKDNENRVFTGSVNVLH